MAYHNFHRLETRIVRIFNTYGPRMRLNDGRALPAFIGQALRGEDLTVFGDGSQTRSFCYVDDLVEGIYRLLLSDYHLPVNIGNPSEITLKQFAEEVITLTGTKQKIVYRPLPEDDPKQRRPDITRARQILGWEPKVGRKEGLRITYEYFKSLTAGRMDQTTQRIYQQKLESNMQHAKIYDDLTTQRAKLAVIGLGYVGLPIALEFARNISVIGFDINSSRIEMMRNPIDPSKEVDAKEFQGRDIVFTDDVEILKQARFFIVAVPTPVDKYNVPDLKPLIGASTTVGKALKKGDYVVYESTTYPGCTEEDCLPILEKISGSQPPKRRLQPRLLTRTYQPRGQKTYPPHGRESGVRQYAAQPSMRSQRPTPSSSMPASIAPLPSRSPKPARSSRIPSATSTSP